MEKKVTFPELVELLAIKRDCTKREAENFLRELIALMTEVVSSGEVLRINGLGVFKPVWVEERASVNVQTGEPSVIPGHYKLTFTPAKAVREAVNEPFACFCVEELPDDAPILSDGSKIDEVDADSADDDEPIDGVEAFVELLENTLPQNADEALPEMHPEPLIEVKEDTDERVAEPEKVDEIEALEVVENPVTLSNDNNNVCEGIQPSSADNIKPEEVESCLEEDDAPVSTPDKATESADEMAENADEKVHKAYHRGVWMGVGATFIVFVVVAIVVCLLLFSPRFDTWKHRFSSLFSTDTVTKTEDVQPIDVLPMDTASRCVQAIDTIVVDAVSFDADSVVVSDLDMTDTEVVTDTIRRGVFLTNVSYRHYGHKAFWVYIYEENSHIIANPDNVPVGTVVVIPPAEKYGIDATDTTAVNVALEKAEVIKRLMRQ